MLTEPVTCSSCGTVSANGGTLHCHGCYQQFVDGYSALRARVAELEATLEVEKDGKTRYRDALVCIQVFSKTQIECLDQSDTEEDNTERANAVWINEKVNAVLGGW